MKFPTWNQTVHNARMIAPNLVLVVLFFIVSRGFGLFMLGSLFLMFVSFELMDAMQDWVTGLVNSGRIQRVQGMFLAIAPVVLLQFLYILIFLSVVLARLQ